MSWCRGRTWCRAEELTGLGLDLCVWAPECVRVRVGGVSFFFPSFLVVLIGALPPCCYLPISRRRGQAWWCCVLPTCCPLPQPPERRLESGCPKPWLWAHRVVSTRPRRPAPSTCESRPCACSPAVYTCHRVLLHVLPTLPRQTCPPSDSSTTPNKVKRSKQQAKRPLAQSRNAKQHCDRRLIH